MRFRCNVNAETVAIVGESGCGKSTLAKVLLGLETATDGDVMLGAVAIGDTEVNDRGTQTVASVQMVYLIIGAQSHKRGLSYSLENADGVWSLRRSQAWLGT